MITLLKGQAVPDSHYLVITAGDYEPTALVDCALPDAHDVSMCAYQANYIATGEFA